MNYKDRVKGCWLGKAIAGGLGAVYEGTPYPPKLKFEDLVLDTGPNDDLELQLLWLVLAEEHGVELTSDDLSQAWLHSIKYGMDEYGVAIWNLRRGLQAPRTGYVDNFFHSGMGAAIRSEIWACLYPEAPAVAAEFARRDSQVDHWGEGIFAEVFLATAESAAFAGGSAEDAFNVGLTFLPEDSAVAKVVRAVMEAYASGLSEDAALEMIMSDFGSYDFTYCVMNLGFMIRGVLYGEGDFNKTVLMTVNCGYDTDCSCATAGAFLGILHGSEVVPKNWVEKLNESISVSDFLEIFPIPKSITDLAERTIALSAKFAEGDRALWPEYSLSDLVATNAKLASEPYPFAPSKWLVMQHQSDAEAEVTQKLTTVPANLADHIQSFNGIHMDFSEFTFENEHVNIFTTVTVPEDLEGQMMICSTGGTTAWLDDRIILNYHGRLKPIPAYQRTEGGACVPVDLKGGVTYRLRIRLYFAMPPLQLTVAVADMGNQYVDAKFLINTCF
ncbi:MAG: ADP-ribosylglycohydrolase family protein [Victivallales bacterium]|nr:ADP-ribosylglycohydrolase family protein [Victivallales bacterium]